MPPEAQKSHLLLNHAGNHVLTYPLSTKLVFHSPKQRFQWVPVGYRGGESLFDFTYDYRKGFPFYLHVSPLCIRKSIHEQANKIISNNHQLTLFLGASQGDQW